MESDNDKVSLEQHPILVNVIKLFQCWTDAMQRQMHKPRSAGVEPRQDLRYLYLTA